METTLPHGRNVVARELELTEIEQALHQGTGVLLTGDPGMGKSSLLQAALARAVRAGLRLTRLEDLEGRYPSKSKAVLGVDDIQFVASELLERVCRLVENGQVLLLATAPSGACLPGAVHRQLLKGRVRRLRVAAFSRSGVAQVLAARIEGFVGADVPTRFWELTQGHPLALGKLVEHTLADGSLHLAQGHWHWRGLQGEPDWLVDLTEVLLGELLPGEREFAALLALAGPLEAGLSVVAESGDAAESLSRKGVVVAERSEGRLLLRLAVPLCAHALAASTPELTARRLRLRVAESLETARQSPGPGGYASASSVSVSRIDFARAAHLRTEAGVPPEPGLLLDAAQAALDEHDFPLAERLCRTVPPSHPVAAESATALVLGAALEGQGQHAQAETCFAYAASRDSTRGASRLILARIRNMAFGLRRPGEAENLVAAVASSAAPDALPAARSLLCLLADRLGGIPALAGAPGEAPGPRPLAAFVRHQLGDGAGALADLEGGSADSDGQGWGDEPTRWAVGGIVTLHTEGTAAATALLDDLRGRGATSTSRGELHLALLEARVRRAAGRTAKAVELSRQAVASPLPDEWLTTRAWRLALLAGALAESGDITQALRLLDESRSAAAREVVYPLAADAVALEHALITAHLGNSVAAARTALEIAERAAAAGRCVQALEALHLAARTGAPAKAAVLLPAAAHASAWATAQADHVRALADQDGSALDRVAAAFETLGFLPLAAEAAAQAAQAHHLAGCRHSSRASRTASSALTARCDTGLPCWTADGAAQDVRPHAELTAREREVAALAASRLSNQEIAGHLVLSVRTVENHLYRAYGKLGITTRAELARHMRGTGSPPAGSVLLTARG